MSIIGVCGDNCSCCPRYIATQERRLEELDKVKELWVRLGFREADSLVQDMACFGCRTENSCAYSELRACAQMKGIDNCGLCNTYPCKLIHAAFKKSERMSFRAAQICTPKELNMLYKAFFSKRQKLDQIHFEKNKEKTK